MPRIGRAVIPGVPLHITQRGTNRGAIFGARADCSSYLDYLYAASRRSSCAVHAYVLMSNHVHLLVTPPQKDSVASMMQWLGHCYARYFNRCYGRTGTLWEGRYKSTPVESGRYFFTCSRYIELNPVRAGMVDHPAEYAWSSYRRNALGRVDRLVTSHSIYASLGSSDDERCASYAELFAAHVDPALVDAIRLSTARGAVLGGTRMREMLEMSTMQDRTSGRAIRVRQDQPFWME
jgi:putative transposase